MHLHPDTTITPGALAAGKRALVFDAAWASMAGSLYGGVILVGFALSLGANSFVIGVLSALPLIAQASQLPAIALVERVQRRKTIAVLAVTVARVLIVGLALLPLLSDNTTQLALLLAAQLSITVFGAITGCALNSWLHQLLPREGLGAFFSKRLFWATVVSCTGTLVAGLVVDHSPLEHLQAYAVVFAAAGMAGFVSSWYLAQVPEPRMTPAGPPASIFTKIRAPFADRSFRRLLLFMGSWNIASNLAAPFVSVYLMKQLGYPLSTVTTLWVSSQVANALTLYAWGRVSDRLSNKAILTVALPTYFTCMLALIFTDEPGRLVLPALYLIHAIMGAAGGGIGLATGNLGLKLAPQGRGTTYLSAIGIVNSIAGGLASVVGGALAQWFTSSQLSLVIRWASVSRYAEVAVIEIARWQFLFAISFVLGFYVLHALSRIDEGEEFSERLVAQQFGLEALRTVNQLSSVAGLLGNFISFGRLTERRLFWRTPRPLAKEERAMTEEQ
ncbi:MAG TPA: MFS transporter [Burkholderiales bacterium]|nr:MFS transporter [Burkholderiales bacterium]